MTTITQSETTNILKLVAGLFDAVPGKDYLEEITEAYIATGNNLGAVAEALGQTVPFQSIYPSTLTTEEFTTKFLTSLGLQDNTEAQEFVTNSVDSGASFATVMYAALVALVESTDEEFAAARDTLTNKARVAEYYSVELGLSSDDLAELQAVVVDVTEDPASVEAAKEAIDNPDGDTSTLTEALENLQAAEQDVADYLESAPELDISTGTVEAGEATATDIATNLSDAVAAVGAAFATTGGTTPTSFATMEAEVQDEFIAAQQALLQAKVTEAKIGQLANLEGLLDTAEAARVARVDAAAAVSLANTAETNTVGAFEAFHTTTLVYSEAGLADYDATTNPGGYEADKDNSGKTYLVNGKFYQGQDGTGTPVALADLKETTATNLQSDVLAAIAAADSAGAAFTNAQTAQQKAVLDVYLALNPDVKAADVVDPVFDAATPVIDATADFEVDYTADLAFTGAASPITADAADTLSTALGNQKTFADAVAELVAARELNDGLVELQTAAAEARAAIENDPDDEDAPGLGIKLVDIDTAVVATADVEELFLFTAETAGDITGFGAEDLLFFGTEYTFVELGADVDFAATRQGSADVLEIFYQVQGANTVFYVENEAEAGRDLNVANITAVELTGVSAALDIDAGFVGLVA